MSYTKFGIRPELVERVKVKMKNPVIKDRIKMLLNGVNKYDLQDRVKVRKLVRMAAGIMQENVTEQQEEQLIAFIVAQKIDPNNTLHLIKLWAMFR
ncbi:serine/threonine protein kinase [Paenibacillus rhizovicinus]|uniref:Serine/threonine protein kinase n=1 Tax=Paenibacillus rhizovicinus TaxID=2704463 RepID=A0A6C0P790_9BACL|nr:stage VI sporulation protein F [Paenibacillus rhizovicinus]QHW34414.1 serine/threonine protein kinase [Paenibacillus rhizovicinus]